LLWHHIGETPQLARTPIMEQSLWNCVQSHVRDQRLCPWCLGFDCSLLRCFPALLLDCDSERRVFTERGQIDDKQARRSKPPL
jgi:hypothetical protein